MSRSEDDERALFGSARGHKQRVLPLVRVVSERGALYRILQPWDEADIPPRPWVAPGYLLRGSVTVLAGPGSVGKSSLVVAWSAAHSLGATYGRFKSATREPLRSLSYNVEDDEVELKRRYSAMSRRLGTTPKALLENLILVGPNEIGTLLGTDRVGGVLVNTEAMDELEQCIGDTKPDTVYLDPFVELHDVEENDNTAIRAVMARFRRMAKEFACAMAIMAHTSKGIKSPGDPDQIRGASSIVGAGRIVLTCALMSENEAQDLGIEEEFRKDFFRLDDAKKNYSRLEHAEWFERREYDLVNGDRVAIPVPWTPPSSQVDQAVLARIVDLIAKGSPDGPWSPQLGSRPRSISHCLEKAGVDGKVAQRQALNQLEASGLVRICQFEHGKKTGADAPRGFRTLSGEPTNFPWIE